jgi:hypothetical protein
MYETVKARPMVNDTEGKGLGEPVEVQPIIVKALWGQKMDFRRPGRIATGQKIWGEKYLENKVQEARPQ